ncbi:MAG TPA: glycosyltransferase [Acidimicrobiales bacterium]|nr:glycosyltransferase [Acidimicrobiales bacterium]
MSPDAPVPEISVVFPTYKRSARLPGLFAALGALSMDPARFEVVAVDNFSQDDTYETLCSLAASAPFPTTVLQTAFNRGPAAARNLGWRTSRAPVVAFLDDDCLPEPDWLDKALARFDTDERLGVLQGGVRGPHGFDAAAMPPWFHSQVIDGPTPYFEACNIFYRREALETTGGFDESIGWWCEDTKLGWQVIEAGWDRSFESGSMVEHAVQQRGWKWHFDNGLLERNTVRIAAEHPGFRREAFWRSWAFRREDAGFVCAVLGLVVGLRYRPALLAMLPYLWWKRPQIGQPRPLRVMAAAMAIDAARTSSHLRAAVENKVLVI